jgi:hypothetical protein
VIDKMDAYGLETKSNRPHNGNSGGSLERSSKEIIEELTPKLLQSAEPDLTIVVGSEEFHHYKQILCQACPFIDTALANEMKESTESCLLFPDRKPNVWRLVYLMLDPFVSEEEKDGLFKSLPNPLYGPFTAGDVRALGLEGEPALKTTSELLELLSFLDYLDMESLVKQYDRQLAKHLVYYHINVPLWVGGPRVHPSGYVSWLICKSYPCPLTLKVIKERYKVEMLLVAFELSSQTKNCRLSTLVCRFDSVTKFLLDDQCGEEMWQHLLSHVDFPDELLDNESREELVDDPCFKSLLEMAGRSIGKPANFECPTELQD